MNDYPLVSVIMNCYNGEEYLKEAIDSVLAQTYSNIEIIFWDNISTDSSRNILESYNDSRIKYFLGESHVSLGEARNFALEKSKGDFISFLDVDDLWHPEKLAQQLPFFSDPTIGLIYCKTDIIKNSEKIVDSFIVNNCENSTRVTFLDLFANYDIYLVSAIISRNALFSLKGNFDNLLEYAEEYDLFMRICFKFDAIKLENILASYRVHEKQSSLIHFERGIFESEYILSKFLLLNPSIFTDQSRLLDKRYSKIAWNKFLNEVLKGNVFCARKRLRSFMFYSFKFFLFYLLSFLGTKPIMLIWKHHRKKRGHFAILS